MASVISLASARMAPKPMPWEDEGVVALTDCDADRPPTESRGSKGLPVATMARPFAPEEDLALGSPRRDAVGLERGKTTGRSM